MLSTPQFLRLQLSLYWALLAQSCNQPTPYVKQLVQTKLGWMPGWCHQSMVADNGFTLAELLIALAILGVIAAFSIPQILTANQQKQYNAAAKEVSGVISAGFQQLQSTGTLSANTKPTDILNSGNLNYVSVDTTNRIDSSPDNNAGTPIGSTPCSPSSPCYVLHNGGKLLVHGIATFTGTSPANSLIFNFDPDGVPAGSQNGPGKSVLFILHYNGRLSSWGTDASYICEYWDGCYTGPPGLDPGWFSWN